MRMRMNLLLLSSMILLLLLLFVFSSAEQQQQQQNEQNEQHYLRRLFGSNCIEIERGIITPYFKCEGCRIESATECLNDMRQNKSGNVHPHCPFPSAFYTNPTDTCCPVISSGNLDYVGSAYPEALRCISRVNCASSLIYTELLKECLQVCPQSDSRNGASICYADFNTASHRHGAVLSYSLYFLITLLCLYFTLP